VSTRTACAPSRTRIASPWPTSSTSITAPRPAGGPIAKAARPTAPITKPTNARRRVGFGHAAHTLAPTATHTLAPAHADHPNATAALGHDASHPAAAAENAPTAPAASSTTSPSGAHTAAAANPASPITSAADTAGPAIRLATGDTSESIPNVPTIRGSVLIVAASVRATGAARNRNQRGSAAASHASPKRAKRTRPATAATERANPKSNALVGEAANTTPAATASVDPPSARRPLNHAPEAATAITHARTAEGCTPEKTT
jgi:hypothetical protein